MALLVSLVVGSGVLNSDTLPEHSLVVKTPLVMYIGVCTLQNQEWYFVHVCFLCSNVSLSLVCCSFIDTHSHLEIYPHLVGQAVYLKSTRQRQNTGALVEKKADALLRAVHAITSLMC